MIVSVTALGSRDGDAASAVARVVDYLDGRSPAVAGRNPGWWDNNGLRPASLDEAGPIAEANDGAIAYYADSVEGPGMWLGRGLSSETLAGEVSREELRRMLLGQDPVTGHQLLDGRGSASRAQHLGHERAAVSPTGEPDELLTLPQAATLLGVSPRYLRRLTRRTAEVRAANPTSEGAEPQPLDQPYLDATQSGPNGHWRVTRAEIARFAAERKPPAAVIGYDLTFSVPKSVSILWARSGPAGQAEILDAVQTAVAAGMSYLEDNAVFVRVGSSATVQRARGLLAASYLHGTSRALDPQLHCHVVVANMAEGPDGMARALDGRALYAHARTASYLAAAELRTQLSRRLGVEWDEVERGLADIAGVPRAAVVEMSKRARELEAVLPQLEAFYTRGNGMKARGRQVAAYITRAAKDERGVDPDALRPWWAEQLDGVGFTERTLRRCLGRQAAVPLVTAEDRERLFALLDSPLGVTEMAATFTRRDVVQRVADWAGDRLGAAEVCGLADAWLATDAVARLEPGRRDGRAGDVIRLRSGRTVSAVGDEALYTTHEILAVEAELFAAYERGRYAGVGVVHSEHVDAALAARRYLGEDQVEMVRSICGSGHRIQCVLGPAGSGKTTALEAAARAWEAAGFRPVGAVVQGTATEVLRDATGIESSTLASLLARLDAHRDDPTRPSPLDPQTVVLVDESSTLPNRELVRLGRYVEHAGAALRLIGDPAQHSAVAAGGGWRALLERHPHDRAELRERRRQVGEEMAEVRMALVEYARGQITEAVERLRRDDRVVEADSPDELLDKLVADWFVDRLRRQASPELDPSSMVADHHWERRELNRRARALLGAHGHLRGPSLDVEASGLSFQAGDEVVVVEQNRRLRPPGAPRRDFARTGERGRVVEVKGGLRPGLVVDLERRGRVVVPEDLLTKKVRPGVVGVVAHSYALTSNLAEGETYETARDLATDQSSRAGVYVGLSRGRRDARLYMIRRRDALPPPDRHPRMPVLEDELTTLMAVTRRLEAERSERLAQEVDPGAVAVAELRLTHSLAELVEIARGPDERRAELARRAYRHTTDAAARRLAAEPGADLVARLGSRPAPGPGCDAWQRAVAAIAAYRARWEPAPVSHGAGVAWAIGLRPGGVGARHYDSVATVIAGAERELARQRPTAELAHERRELARCLAASPGPAQRDDAVSAAEVAHDRLAQCRRSADEARDRLAALGQGRRRNRQGLELARRRLAEAERNVAAAALAAQRADERAAAVGADVEVQTPVRERLALVEHALDAQVAEAVARPGAYLRNALGPRPDDEGAQRWDRAAERVESYRHRELGMSPMDGALPHDDVVDAAIGPRPGDDYLASLAWDRVARSLDPAVELNVHPELPAPALEL